MESDITETMAGRILDLRKLSRPTALSVYVDAPEVCSTVFADWD